MVRNNENQPSWGISKTGAGGKREKHCNHLDKDGFKCMQYFTTFEKNRNTCEEHTVDNPNELRKGSNKHTQRGNEERLRSFLVELMKTHSKDKAKLANQNAYLRKQIKMLKVGLLDMSTNMDLLNTQVLLLEERGLKNRRSIRSLIKWKKRTSPIEYPIKTIGKK